MPAFLHNMKWRALVGLIMVFVAVVMNWNWVWGVLFLFWIIPDIFRGVTHFLEPIEASENPVMFWLIVVTWLLLSLYLLVIDALYFFGA